MPPSPINCFKAYDIRGRVPEELNPDIAYRIGRAYAEYLNPGQVIVGRDVRLQSASLAAAVSDGLLDGGAGVLDIGLCGTEEIYFQTFHRGSGGGIMVTASHNPMDYNGMKLVRQDSRPISGDTGLYEIRALAEQNIFQEKPVRGVLAKDDNKQEYIQHLLSYIDINALQSLKVVANAGNGCAGPVMDLLTRHLPINLVRIHFEPDGSFPHGIPNPLLPENRNVTSEAVIRHQADIGIAWDGDFDRCFFFDEKGRFIEGYYLVGLMAEVLLEKTPGAGIIHDPRLTWNTIDLVTQKGGVPIQSKTGHAFIKERMRCENAIYGGEMSAHHYFRDFAYCDSGMIPWLLIVERLSKTGQPLSVMVDERMRAFPCSGEINFVVDNTGAILNRIRNYFAADHPDIDETDGLSFTFPAWRFNLRSSNTEPLLRLNVETRADEVYLRDRVSEIKKVIEGNF
ncbi:MAG: phosphomannomutase CpsG [Syntrophaceae bacterium]|jgi:phosphomannomutase / phosphoglucomutase|nr:phosphomannomutase CpsG [Syntrophaceae bacterium]